MKHPWLIRNVKVFAFILSCLGVLNGAEPPADFPVPKMTAANQDVEPFHYSEAKVPYYPAGEAWGTQGEPLQRMQAPLRPAESIKHFVTPSDFQLRLFAAEPDITKPICMTWDERGRLWVAESVDYPNQRQPEGQGRDRIKICEDTDGDGLADRFTVFADKLSIPTSIAPAFGGVVVHQAPDTLFLKDTTGDDVADVRRVLFTGWSTHDTHAGPSNLRYGPDNWYWGLQGYAGFDGEIAGMRRSFNRGFYRFRLTLGGDGLPRVEDFEFLRSTDNNTWGIGFSEDGLAFGSTANRNPSVYLPVANRYYEAVRGWSTGPLKPIANNHLFQPITRNVRQVDHHGGYTAAAGHALYTARQYPAEYWNRVAFVCGPTGHLVGSFVLKRDGADVRSANLFNLLASDDEWSAPIAAEVGPDGNVWVIDWYNYIVQHNPTPAGFQRGKGNAYKSELRDKQHGRVYRVVYRGREPANRVSLENANPRRLVSALRNNNMFWRKHAQRLLVERGDLALAAQLLKLVEDWSVDEIGLNPGALHALWTLHGLRAFEQQNTEVAEAAVKALGHPSAAVRRAAIGVLPRNREVGKELLQAETHSDRDALVRLATLLAISELPPEAALGEVVAAMLEKPENSGDAWILDAATSAAARNSAAFLEAMVGAQSPHQETLARMSVVAEHLTRGNQRGVARDLVPKLAEADPSVVDAVLTGLARGWPEDTPLRISDTIDEQLIGLLDKASASGRGALGKLATLWGSREIDARAPAILDSLLQLIDDDAQSETARIVAARQLAVFRGNDDDAVERLLKAVDARMPSTLAARVISTVSESRAPNLANLLIEQMRSLTPVAQASAIRILLARPQSSSTLLDALEDGSFALSDLSLDQKQALMAHPDSTIASRAAGLLASRGDLPNSDRQQVLNSLKPLLERQGDAELGKSVFAKQCSKCHTHGGIGATIGPDLTGMAVHPKIELLTHLIDPSRSVEGNYRVYSIVTTDGRVLTGLLTSETETTIELVDAEGKKQGLLREDIDELVASPKSLMPDGFEKQVSETELIDLLEFLTQRGKYLPIPFEKFATVVSTRGMFTSEANDAERLVFSEWSPKEVKQVPFHLVHPQGARNANAIMLYSPLGRIPPRMPKSVTLPCNSQAKAIHMLSGVSGWGYPVTSRQSVSMIVRLKYVDGEAEEHPLVNGVHFADYVGQTKVSGSEPAFRLAGRQLRYLSINPRRPQRIETIELVKGADETAPVVMAMTVELP